MSKKHLYVGICIFLVISILLSIKSIINQKHEKIAWKIHPKLRFINLLATILLIIVFIFELLVTIFIQELSIYNYKIVFFSQFIQCLLLFITSFKPIFNNLVELIILIINCVITLFVLSFFLYGESQVKTWQFLGITVWGDEPIEAIPMNVSVYDSAEVYKGTEQDCKDHVLSVRSKLMPSDPADAVNQFLDYIKDKILNVAPENWIMTRNVELFAPNIPIQRFINDVHKNTLKLLQVVPQKHKNALKGSLQSGIQPWTLKKKLNYKIVSITLRTTYGIAYYLVLTMPVICNDTEMLAAATLELSYEDVSTPIRFASDEKQNENENENKDRTETDDGNETWINFNADEKEHKVDDSETSQKRTNFFYVLKENAIKMREETNDGERLQLMPYLKNAIEATWRKTNSIGSHEILSEVIDELVNVWKTQKTSVHPVDFTRYRSFIHSYIYRIKLALHKHGTPFDNDEYKSLTNDFKEQVTAQTAYKPSENIFQQIFAGAVHEMENIDKTKAPVLAYLLPFLLKAVDDALEDAEDYTVYQTHVAVLDKMIDIWKYNTNLINVLKAEDYNKVQLALKVYLRKIRAKYNQLKQSNELTTKQLSEELTKEQFAQLRTKIKTMVTADSFVGSS